MAVKKTSQAKPRQIAEDSTERSPEQKSLAALVALISELCSDKARKGEPYAAQLMGDQCSRHIEVIEKALGQSDG